MAKKRDETGMQSKLMNAAKEGYAKSFAELMESTAWDKYGAKSGNIKCKDCMVHSGFEASAVNDTFSSFGGLVRTAKATLFPF